MDDPESVGAGALLDEIFRGTPGLREPEAPSPDDEALVAYLSGALLPEEAARVEQGLVSHPMARRRLHAVSERLDSLQTAPWSALETANDGVGHAWRALTSSRLAEVPAARSRWVAAGWEAVRAQAAMGIADAQAAWSVFLSFAGQWESARRVPKLAESRGGATAAERDALPPGVAMTLEADVTQDGSLTARAWLHKGGGPSTALEGRTATLVLAMDADAWPLADAIVRDGAAVWNLTGAGWELGLSPGPLPTGDLKVSFNPLLAPVLPDIVRVIMARDVDDGYISVALHGQPRREAGRLRLTLTLDTPTRAAHAKHRLAVSALIAPGLHQRLGAWPVADWGETARAVDMPCPGTDGDFDPAALSLELIA